MKRCLWQVVGRFERQLKQTVHQLQSEQQRAANTCLEKDRQVRSVDIVTQNDCCSTTLFTTVVHKVVR